MPDPIRILVVDDHAVVREGLRAFLALQEGFEIVGEAADGDEALERAAELDPDVILMDLVMPGRDGVSAMRELHMRGGGPGGTGSRPRVIVLTSFLDDDRLLPAIEAGAAGYLLKNSAPAELARAVRAAHAGEAIIDPTAAARLVDALSSKDRTSRGAAEPLDQLTGREREVLTLIAGGRSNKRIALELGISEKTVKAHVGHVLSKLGVTDRTQAAVLAVQAGLVQKS
ncbi:MAG: response regulator [Solirubrobacteraceae bacterium]